MTRPIQFTLMKICLTLIVTQACSQVLLAQSAPQLNRKFAKRVTVEIKDEPIGKFLNDLAREHKVTIKIDSYKIAADGFSIDDTISLSLKNVSLLTVIKLASESLELTCLPEGSGLFVTTHPVAQDLLYERQYNVPWIRTLRVDASALTEAIYTTTSGPWLEIDQEGGEFTAVGPAAFRARQNWQNHQEMENLIFQFESIIRGKGEYRGSPAELEIMKLLQKNIEQSEGASTLSEYLNNLLAENGINFWIDNSELSNEGIASNVMIEFTPGKKSIFEHLSEALSPHGIVPYIDGEVVKITTTPAAKEELTIRVYDVRKQVRQVGTATAVQDVIEKTAGTGLWQNVDQDGGGIQEVGPLLAISQNRAGHRKLIELLK